jgi:hypothetical protein
MVQESSLAPQAEGDASMLPDTPEDLAAVDPLAGFLASEPLPRIRFLLQQHQGNAGPCTQHSQCAVLYLW